MNQQSLDEILANKTDAPIIVMESIVVFPFISLPLILKKQASVLAFEEAMNKGGIIIFLLFDRDKGLSRVGTVAHISQAMKTDDGSIRLLVEGLERVKIKKITQEKPYPRGDFEIIWPSFEENEKSKALIQGVLAQFRDCINAGKQIPLDLASTIFTISDIEQLADVLAFNLDIKPPERQEILEIINPVKRLKKINELLVRETTILKAGKKLKEDTAKKFGEMSREAYLKEQLRSIKRELGIDGKKKGPAKGFKDRLSKAKFPKKVKAVVKKEIERLKDMPIFSPEIGNIRTYLDWLFDLPWGKRKRGRLDIKKAAKILDDDHHGLEKAKERILEYLAVQKKVGKIKGPILCFVGPPGTGKTSIGRSIASSLGRDFIRISLGGVRDEAEIRGHRRTYVGALPGRIIQGVKNSGTSNPVFMLDEIDKLGNDFRGDPSSALLEALDSEQNNEFSDHYLEVPFDLSDVMFITTANVLDDIPWALRDRMEVIRFPGFTAEEKFKIAKDYLLPRLLKDHGLKKNQLVFNDKALSTIIRSYTYEAGVRSLERELAKVCRKVVRKLLEDKRLKGVLIDKRNLRSFLGPESFKIDLAEKTDEVGVVTGLAWTEAGGDILTIEAITIPGKGALKLTGSLGDVMQESAQAAYSFAKHLTKKVPRYAIHLHVPSGGIPKDGPSGGIAMATALVSILENRPVKREIAMTGEVTLRGRVLEVGGVKEKILSAYRSGVKIVILPMDNKKNLVDIPKEIRKKLKFVFVDRMEEVLKVALKGKRRKR